MSAGRAHRWLGRRWLALLLLLAPGVAAGLAAGATPRLPQATVDTSPGPGAGRTIAVPAGGDLQAALDRAQPGDVITLEAGATYAGSFTLPRKTGDEWITLRTSESDASLPPGRRVHPSQAPRMPKLVASAGSVLATAPGAHHYRFIGLEIRPKEGVFLKNLVELGTGETSLEGLAHHFIVERCYIHGDPKKGARRGIALNAREAAVIDSYLADFKEVGADSQAIAGWRGPGPYKIVNNYLEGAGENLLFGGGDPPIANLVPSDIEIRKNHLAKPLAWKAGAPGFEGTTWQVKNLLELKNARRVVIDGNLLEHNWPQAQSGYAILFTVRNQDGRAPWSVVEDVTFTNNILRHTAQGMNISGRDDLEPSRWTRRILIRNNLFDDVGGARWGGSGILFQIINGVTDLVIEHNTAFQIGNIITTEGPAAHQGFVFRDNILPHNAYGIIGAGTSPGNASIERFFPGAVVEGNVIAGANGAHYPRKNAFPSSLEAVGFVDRAGGDYRLSERSRFRSGTNGKSPGADPAGLDAARTAQSPSAPPR